jgi:uncharacterized protein DUF5723
MRKMLFVWLGLCIGLSLHAQYNLGIGSSNYSGIQGSRINPGVTAGNPFSWEINGLTVDALYDNTFVYTPRHAVPAFGFRALIEGIIHNQHYATNYVPNDPDRRYQFTLSGEIMGPSFNMKLNNDQTIGFSMAVRTNADIRDLTGTTAQGAWAYLQEPDLWNRSLSDHSSRLDGMSWLEYGLNYSAVLLDNGNDQLKAGIHVKYLQGMFAAYVKNTNLNYTIGDTTVIRFTNSSVDYGRTDYDSYRKIGDYGDLNHGHGFGVDLGAVYVHGTKTREPDDYQYRLGLSVLDIGAINFNRNAAAFHLQDVGTDPAVFNNWRQQSLMTNLAVDKALSAVFYNGDSSRSLIDHQFKMGLPTAISLQADYRIRPHFYVNATLIKGFGHGGGQGAVQPDVYGVTPRYESRWYDISVPLSLLYYGQWRARAGLAVRAGYFFFGGDAPFPMLMLAKKMQGADVYAGVRFYVFKKS